MSLNRQARNSTEPFSGDGSMSIEQLLQSTTPKQQSFINGVVSTGTIRGASKATNISTANHYRWLDNDPRYRRVFNRALQSTVIRLEDGLVDRLLNGTEKPVFYKGEQCGTITEFDNSNTLRYLMSVAPERFSKPSETNIAVQNNVGMEGNQGDQPVRSAKYHISSDGQVTTRIQTDKGVFKFPDNGRSADSPLANLSSDQLTEMRSIATDATAADVAEQIRSGDAETDELIHEFTYETASGNATAIVEPNPGEVIARISRKHPDLLDEMRADEE